MGIQSKVSLNRVASGRLGGTGEANGVHRGGGLVGLGGLAGSMQGLEGWWGLQECWRDWGGIWGLREGLGGS